MHTRPRESYLPALPSVPSLTSELTIESPNVSPEYKLRSGTYHSYAASISQSPSTYYASTGQRRYKPLEHISPSSSAGEFIDQSHIDAKYLSLELDSMKRENGALERQTIQLRKRVEELEIQNLRIADRARQEGISSLINGFQLRSDVGLRSPSEGISPSPIVSPDSESLRRRVPHQELALGPGPRHLSNRPADVSESYSRSQQRRSLKSPIPGDGHLLDHHSSLSKSLITRNRRHLRYSLPLEPLTQEYAHVPRLRLNPHPLRRPPIPEFPESSGESGTDAHPTKDYHGTSHRIDGMTVSLDRSQKLNGATHERSRQPILHGSGRPKSRSSSHESPSSIQRYNKPHTDRAIPTHLTNEVTRRRAHPADDLIVPNLQSILGFQAENGDDRRSVQSPLPIPTISCASQIPPRVLGSRNPTRANMSLDSAELALRTSEPSQFNRTRHADSGAAHAINDHSGNSTIFGSIRYYAGDSDVRREFPRDVLTEIHQAPQKVNSIISGDTGSQMNNPVLRRAGTPFFETRGRVVRQSSTPRNVTSKRPADILEADADLYTGALRPNIHDSSHSIIDGNATTVRALEDGNTDEHPATTIDSRHRLDEHSQRVGMKGRGVHYSQASLTSRATGISVLEQKSDKENIAPSRAHPTVNQSASSARSATLLQLLSSPMVHAQAFPDQHSISPIQRPRSVLAENNSFRSARPLTTELAPSDSVSRLAMYGNEDDDTVEVVKSPVDSTHSFSIASMFSGTHLPDLPPLPELTPSPTMVPFDSFQRNDELRPNMLSVKPRQSLPPPQRTPYSKTRNTTADDRLKKTMGRGAVSRTPDGEKTGLPIDGSFAAELRSLVTKEEYRRFVKDVMEYDNLLIDRQQFLANARGLFVTPERTHLGDANLHDRLRLYGLLAKSARDFEG